MDKVENERVREKVSGVAGAQITPSNHPAKREKNVVNGVALPTKCETVTIHCREVKPESVFPTGGTNVPR
jgi:hypothetical protein